MFGAKLSSFFFTIFGTLSYVLALYALYAGFVLLLGIKKRRLFTKFIILNFSIIFLNLSFLIQGVNIINYGLFSDFLFNILFFYLPVIESNFLIKNVLSIFLLSASIFLFLFSFLGLGLLVFV